MTKQDINLLLTNDEYMADLCVRMAHHSTAIEGNTLTQDETASILLNGYISGQTSEREFYEVRNYKDILPAIVDNLNKNKLIDAALIKDFYFIIMRDLLDNRGQFKTIENIIIGATFETTKPYLVPVKIKEMCDNLYFKFAIAASDDEILRAIFEAHIEFEKIHPFSDGNGRVGRLLMIYSCLEQGLVPIIIPKEQKGRYISILRAGDVGGFLDFGRQIQADESERCAIFLRNFKQNIN